MISFPGSKINVGLTIAKKLPNGYHSIESVFLPVWLSDILEIVIAPESEPSTYNYTGLTIPGDNSKNIIKKAYEMLDKEYGLPSIQAHLHKIVPMGAGLGGGSADASAMLVMLNKMFDLNISQTQLLIHAGSLGADCPFFIEKKPAFVSGIGEIISPVNINLSTYTLLLVYPHINVNTATAFLNITPRKPNIDMVSTLNYYPVNEWKNHLKNDFEPYVFSTFPEILMIKEKLYKMGAVFASLSGSGSAVYGIFNKNTPLRSEIFQKYFTFSSQL